MHIPVRLLSKSGAVRERCFLRAALPPTEQRKEKKIKIKIKSLGLANATVLTCHLNLTYAGRSWGERAGTELGEKGGS